MKKALIEIASGRIAEIADAEFPVHASLQWVDAPADATIATHEWNGSAVIQKAGPSLDVVKAAKLTATERARDASRYANVTAHGRPWQSDPMSQNLIGQAITLGMAGVPLPPVWRDANNNDMAITSIADLLAIAGAMAQATQAAYAKSWLLKAQINAATTSTQVEAVQW